MKFSLTAAVFILVHLRSSYAAPLTSSSPMQRAEPTSPVTSNTTIGIAARAPPANAQLGNNHFIVMHGQGSLSCSKDAANLQYLEDSMVSMMNQLRSANKVLGVPGVEKSVGAREFFGPNANIESIRATHYERPMQFISSADQKPVESDRDIELYPHPGKAILFGCPTTPEAQSEFGQCVRNEHILAYTLMQEVQYGLVEVTGIMFCPQFFLHYVLNENNLGTEAGRFKAAFKNIVQGQEPSRNFASAEGGHVGAVPQLSPGYNRMNIIPQVILHELQHATGMMGDHVLLHFGDWDNSLRSILSIPAGVRSRDPEIVAMAASGMELAPEIFNPSCTTISDPCFGKAPPSWSPWSWLPWPWK